MEFWKTTDDAMCKFPRVAIGAGTLFLDFISCQKPIVLKLPVTSWLKSNWLLKYANVMI